jgi:hypothetical protein
MKSTELPALAELRESLREAAARDIAARKPRRRRRRGIAVVLVVLLGGAAAAGAADLISSGQPVKDERPADPRYDSSGQLQLALKATDTPLPWGVQVYQSSKGQECALLGRVSGAQLGQLDDKNVFHRYAEGRSGACGSTQTHGGGFNDIAHRNGRTVIYGRAREGSSVTVVVDGESKTVSAGPDGAFLFVYRGNVELSDFRID